MKVGMHADHKIVSKGEESMTSKWDVEKNQAKRTHAGGGDKQKVREREETG